jgi:hypothetical protein
MPQETATVISIDEFRPRREQSDPGRIFDHWERAGISAIAETEAQLRSTEGIIDLNAPDEVIAIDAEPVTSTATERTHVDILRDSLETATQQEVIDFAKGISSRIANDLRYAYIAEPAA